MQPSWSKQGGTLNIILSEEKDYQELGAMISMTGPESDPEAARSPLGETGI
jgi:hypothetical protein